MASMSGFIALCLLIHSSLLVASDSLTLQDRIRAQKAILQVYLSHQEGLGRQPEERALDEAAERRVRTYLALSRALEDRWKLRVTPAMLQAELDRIARNTRFADRLTEVFSALGNDPYMIAECFARPVLVERLARNFHDGDRRIHAAARHEAEEILASLLSGALDPGADHPRRTVLNQEEGLVCGEESPVDRSAADPSELIGAVSEYQDRFEVQVRPAVAGSNGRTIVYAAPKESFDDWWTRRRVDAGTSAALPSRGDEGRLRIPDLDTAGNIGCADDDTWDNAGMDEAPTSGGGPAVWTGSVVLIWWRGLQYDPLTDTWSRISMEGAPVPLSRQTAIWAGDALIVWGGDSGVYSNEGGLYDPVSDTWRSLPTAGAPSARSNHTAVWTGSEMVIWGGSAGSTFFNSGGRYDPVSDTWRATSLSGAPSARIYHSAVWTGTEMIVWGGVGFGFFVGGARYDPETDSWRPVNSLGEPTIRPLHAAVWTGTEMIIWGGWSEFDTLTDGAYDPATDSWHSVTRDGGPVHRPTPGAAWTGSRMLVWGGGQGFDQYGTGGQYDPATDTWTATSLLNAPEPRSKNAWAWTGDLFIVWGGTTDFDSRSLYNGGRYDPRTDTWTPMLTTSNLPQPRSGHSAVWTGTEMIIWGGRNSWARYADGYRYDPLTDSWSRTSLAGAPVARADHTAVWTGTEMIVWGGDSIDIDSDTDLRFNSGGRYSPLTDTWSPTFLMGAPPPRKLHTAVWTGTKMIVWGGIDQLSVFGASPLGTGGVYDPASDSWTDVQALGAPEARFRHTAVWDDSEMIVWGGSNGATALGTGGRYDPVSRIWTQTSLTNSPAPRLSHTAVWTGQEMIVFGGSDQFQTLDTGARYRPASDSWQTVSPLGTPEARALHTAIWTGWEMMVWGGIGARGIVTASGGRYDPAGDRWSATTLVGAPPLRLEHSMVWTGTHAIVWGGGTSTGGRYVISDPPDADGDGSRICTGDCNEGDPAVHPGADEICDGRDDDCDGAVPAGEADTDGDGFRSCGGDCNDSDPRVSPSATELPGNRLDENCDGVLLCDPDAPWKNRGELVGCVARECSILVTEGLATPRQCQSLISKAPRPSSGSL